VESVHRSRQGHLIGSSDSASATAIAEGELHHNVFDNVASARLACGSPVTIYNNLTASRATRIPVQLGGHRIASMRRQLLPHRTGLIRAVHLGSRQGDRDAANVGQPARRITRSGPRAYNTALIQPDRRCPLGTAALRQIDPAFKTSGAHGSGSGRSTGRDARAILSTGVDPARHGTADSPGRQCWSLCRRVEPRQARKGGRRDNRVTSRLAVAFRITRVTWSRYFWGIAASASWIRSSSSPSTGHLMLRPARRGGAGPALQVFRGVVFAVVLYPSRVFLERLVAEALGSSSARDPLHAGPRRSIEG